MGSIWDPHGIHMGSMGSMGVLPRVPQSCSAQHAEPSKPFADVVLPRQLVMSPIFESFCPFATLSFTTVTVPFCSHLLSSPAVTETLVALVASIDSQAGQASCRNNGGGLTSFSTHGKATFYPSVTTECIHLRRRKTFLRRFCSKLKMALVDRMLLEETADI